MISEQVRTPFVIQPVAWDRLLKAGRSLDDVGAKEVVVAMGQRCNQIVHRCVFPSMRPIAEDVGFRSEQIFVLFRYTFGRPMIDLLAIRQTYLLSEIFGNANVLCF